MKKSPHRFLLFMCSRCSCSFSPCRRLHVLKAGSNWIESVCGKVPIRFSKPTPWVFLHVKQRPQSREPAFTRVVWPHSQRTPRHKGHEIQNGRTHCPSLLHHGASAKTVQACCPLCTCPPPLLQYILRLLYFLSLLVRLFSVHYCMFMLPKCNLAF